MLRNGTAMVEVRSLEPANAPLLAQGAAPARAPNAAAPVAAPLTATPPSETAVGNGGDVSTVPVPRVLFIQAGAFSRSSERATPAEKLRGGGYGQVFVRDDEIAGRRMYRVRIGPVPDVAEFDRIVAALERAGISDAHLALD